MNSRWSFLLILIFQLCVGCVSTVKNSLIDTSLAAVDANDKTLPLEIQGCIGGRSLAVDGFYYCRVRENSPTSLKIIFIAPKVDCKMDDPCRYIKIFRPGSTPLEYSFRKDKTFLEVPWKDIVGEDTFQKYQDKYLGVRQTIHWLDEDERARKTIFDGEIRLKILSEDYTSLSTSKANKFFVWKVKYKDQTIMMTTAGRVGIVSNNN